MNKYPWYINHVVSFKFFPDYDLLINIHSPYLSPAKGYFFVSAANFISVRKQTSGHCPKNDSLPVRMGGMACLDQPG